MTNISTIIRASVWVAVAATLMSAALEPVQVKTNTTQVAVVAVLYATA